MEENKNKNVIDTNESSLENMTKEVEMSAEEKAEYEKMLKEEEELSKG